MNTESQRVLAAKSFEDLFRDAATITDCYHGLAQQVHPDHGGDHDAFAKLTGFYREAREKAAKGWIGAGRLEFQATDGKTYRVMYAQQQQCGLATTYHGTTMLTYSLPNDAADLAQRAKKTIEGLGYPSAAMEEKLRRQLPNYRGFYHTTDRAMLILHKPKDLIRLTDLLSYVGGQLDERHVAWIISRALSMCSYLDWAGLVHNDLSLTSIYIVPAQHSMTLLGGWWHTVKAGSRLPRLLPGRTYNELPSRLRTTKLASMTSDLLLVRRLGRELLGDPDGLRMRTTKDVRAPLAAWLMSIPSSNSALKDFEGWQKVLDDSFGVRRFVELDVHASDIYYKE